MSKVDKLTGAIYMMNDLFIWYAYSLLQGTHSTVLYQEVYKDDFTQEKNQSYGRCVSVIGNRRRE